MDNNNGYSNTNNQGNSYSYGYGGNVQGGYNMPDYNNNNNRKKEGGFAKGVAVGIVCSLLAFCIIILANQFLKKDGNNTNNDDLLSSLFGSNDEDSIFTEEQLEKLNLIQQYIELYSYYEQDNDKFIDGVYSALLGSLDDDYAVYYNKEAYTAILESTSGEYYGIGCVVTQNSQTGYVTVVQPYKNSPAYEAGIAVGDIILKADDVELTGMDLNEAVSYMKGGEGTPVTLTIIHDGEEKKVEVERRKIEVPTVEYEMLEDNIGYVQITGFEDVTEDQFSEAVDSLIADGAKGLVFDVRSNPGGSYDVVVAMLDKLLPEGTLVYTEDKYGNRQTETSDADCVELPMAVIINGDSASASEIFAGAMQDYDAAEIIGTTSYGKGIVQSVIPMGDGTGIKFTIASYFTPKGVCIHGVGIEPDETVELPQDKEAYDENGYLKEEYDTQLDAAIKYINEQTK